MNTDVVLLNPTRERVGAIGAFARRIVAVGGEPSLRDLQVHLPGLVVLESSGLAIADANRGLVLRTADALLVHGTGAVREAALRGALDASDRVGSASTAGAVLFRHWVLHAAGCLDVRLATIAEGLEQWKRRSSRLGLRHVHVAAEEAPRVEVLRFPEEGPEAIARALAGPSRLVLWVSEVRRDPLLFAAARGADALIVGSEEHRAALEDAIGPHTIPVAGVDALDALMRRAASAPENRARRHYAALAQAFSSANASASRSASSS